jgi:hypothetical protein
MNSLFSFSGLVAIVGVALIALGIFAFFRRRAQIKHSIVTTGSVVELLPQRQSGEYVIDKNPVDGVKIKPKYLYRPVVSFKTESGRTVKFSASVSSSPKPFQIGDQVEVIYVPDQPKKAQINRFMYLWFNVLMLLFFGFFALGMGLVGVLAAG